MISIRQAVRKATERDFRTACAGFAVVEFVVVLPALLFFSYLAVWLIGLGVLQLQLHNDAVTAVRFIARGDSLPRELKPDFDVNRIMTVRLNNQMVHVDMAKRRKLPIVNRDIEIHAHAVARTDTFHEYG